MNEAIITRHVENLRSEVERLRTEQAAVFAALRDALGTLPATFGQAATQAVKAIAERDRLRAEVEKEREAVSEVLKERDEREALLDQFAWRVAPIEVIGEHSSGNDPWANAMDLVTPALEVEAICDARDAAREQVQRAKQVRVWRNEDGKGFMFADDLRAALNGTEADR